MRKRFKKRLDLQELKDFLATQSPETKIYIGCDSIRFKKNGVFWADYALVVVVHMDGKHGCRIFGEVTTERDYDKRGSCRMRMFTEASKACELFQLIKPLIAKREIEVHLDINRDPKFLSNESFQQAVGYVQAMCGLLPKTKPDAWAASYAADRIAHYH